MSGIREGGPAPDVLLTTYRGERYRLQEFVGRQPVVVFFYPKDGTPVCTQEACAFRDAFDEFTDTGAAVFGVSGDSVERHTSFASEHKLPFHLVSDADGALRAAFGVPKSMGLLPGRVTYVIDVQGIVRRVFSAQLASDRHVQEALQALRGFAP